MVIFLLMIISSLLLYKKFKKPEKYDYEAENPNALISGKNISGTVYSSNTEDSPGLGWVL